MGNGVGIIEGEQQVQGERMRPQVKSIYNRQVARCLADIEEVYELPSVVEERIKRAVEYTAKDVDKINKGVRHGTETNGNV